MDKTWKQMWKDHLERHYADAAERWEHETKDDRLVFCITYRKMQEALDSLPDEPHIFIQQAVTSKIWTATRMMDKILEVFKGR